MAEDRMVLRLPELTEIGGLLAKSGYFQDAKEMAQAVVKVMAGRELGIPPVAAMTGINIIKGKVGLSATLMAGLVKRSGKYDYKVMELTDTACELQFFERSGDAWVLLGPSRFEGSDAKRAETQNMGKFPRNMLFARAMSNGFKWFCADLSDGPIYTPEELGAKVDERGDVIEIKAKVVSMQPKSKAEAAQTTEEPEAGTIVDADIMDPEPPQPGVEGHVEPGPDPTPEEQAAIRAQEEAEGKTEDPPPPVKVSKQRVWNLLADRAKKEGKSVGILLNELVGKKISGLAGLDDSEVARLAKKLEG